MIANNALLVLGMPVLHVATNNGRISEGTWTLEKPGSGYAFHHQLFQEKSE